MQVLSGMISRQRQRCRSPEGRDSPAFALQTCLTKAKDGTVQANDVDSAEVALKKMKFENEVVSRENYDLRRRNEELTSRAEQAERDEVGMREQGPQSVKDKMFQDLYAETERLKAELQRHQIPQHNDQIIGQQAVENEFEVLLGTYLKGKKPCSENSHGLDTRQFKRDGKGSTCTALNEATSVRLQMQGHHPCQPDATNAMMRQHLQADPETRTLLENASSAACLRRSSSADHQVMLRAGTTAQRRRSLSSSRRSSGSSLSSRRNSRDSLNLSKFMDVLNSSNYIDGKLSGLSCLIISVLTAAGRPVEVHRLQVMLRDSITRAETEFFLRCRVVHTLVSQIQSPNAARVFDNVCPSLVESSCHFVEKINNQCPVTDHRYSCPASI